MFLFQIGAIKTTTYEFNASERSKVFLFQIGAIKTILATLTCDRQSCFYSRLVRLKLEFRENRDDIFKVSIPDWCD